MRSNFATALIALICVSGCGGSGSSLGGSGGGSTGGSSNPIAGAASNVAPITVDTGPAALGNPDVNTLFTTIIICAPGSTTNCQTIDHIQVDTASSGLRILASALSLSLPLQSDGSGNATAECTQFVDGYSWGPLRTADVKVSGESATSIAVQVIGDPGFAGSVPDSCSNNGKLKAENTVQTFGANGILGVAPFIADCGPRCASPTNGTYYSCSSGSDCLDAAVPEAAQVSNPVAFFATDNNGIIIELPTVAASGAASVSGSLVFGIGTQSNNGLASASVFTVSTSNGSLQALYKGNSLTNSFIDSGSNAYYFPDSTIKVCDSSTSASGFFCPNSTENLSATITGQNSVSTTFNFSVANADNLFKSNATVAAAINLAAPNTDTSAFDSTDTFDFGLPFYFGRNVYTAIESRNTSGGVGPYFAF